MDAVETEEFNLEVSESNEDVDVDVEVVRERMPTLEVSFFIKGREVILSGKSLFSSACVCEDCLFSSSIGMSLCTTIPFCNVRKVSCLVCIMNKAFATLSLDVTSNTLIFLLRNFARSRRIRLLIGSDICLPPMHRLNVAVIEITDWMLDGSFSSVNSQLEFEFELQDNNVVSEEIDEIE